MDSLTSLLLFFVSREWGGGRWNTESALTLMCTPNFSRSFLYWVYGEKLGATKEPGSAPRKCQEILLPDFVLFQIQILKQSLSLPVLDSCQKRWTRWKQRDFCQTHDLQQEKKLWCYMISSVTNVVKWRHVNSEFTTKFKVGHKVFVFVLW